MTVFGKRIPLWVWAVAWVLAARAVAMCLLPIMDTTEGRYAQVAQEMVMTGDWVTPRVWMNEAHLPFLGKPPLFFWLSACASEVFGVNAFAVRLPSWLSMCVLVLLAYRVTERHIGAGCGKLGVAVTLSCAFFCAIGGTVAVDMLLGACVAGSLLAYYAFIREAAPAGKRRWSLLVFLFLALGFLTKGPVALVLFGLPVFLWTVRFRQWKGLRGHSWTAGVVLFLLLTVPWFVVCEARNPGFLRYFFVNENLLRFITPDYGDAYGVGHQYLRGTALLMMAGATAPWCLAGGWLFFGRRYGAEVRRLSLRDPGVHFLFLGFVPGVLFWCFARQLLITYLLPLTPLFAAWLVAVIKDRPPLRRTFLAASTALLFAMGAVCLGCCPFLWNVSTARGIVALARRIDPSEKEPLLFVRKTPYSALFYARGWVKPHPKETLRETLARYDESTASLLVIGPVSTRGAFELLAPERVSRLGTVGGWELARVTCGSVAGKP